MTHITSNSLTPQNWQQVKLGDVFDFKNGLNKEKKYFGIGTPIINYLDVFNGGGLFINKIKGLVEVTKSEKERFDVRKGDVFFTRTSETLNEIGFSNVALDNFKDTVFSGFVLRARLKSDLLLPYYALYCFKTNEARQEIKEKSSYTTRALTSGSLLNRVSLSLPPLPEQHRIVAVLETWDNVIEKLAKKIEIKKEIKKGLMQDLLTGKKRVEGFSDKWEIKKLGDLLKERIERETESDSLILYSLTIENGVCPKGERYDRSFLVKSDSKIYKKTCKNDIVYNPANLRFGAITQNKNKCPVLLSPIYQVLFNKDENKNNIDFIGHLLTWDRQIKKMSIYAEGTLIERMEVKIDSFKLIQVYIPTKKEQDIIADMLNVADNEIKAIEKKLEIIKEQKKYLLNNLITGKIRTPENMKINKNNK